jgi:hypothetical protein
MVFMPGDIVEQENDEYRVLGIVDRRKFLVKSLSSGAESVRTLSHCGFLSAAIVQRPSFFD